MARGFILSVGTIEKWSSFRLVRPCSQADAADELQAKMSADADADADAGSDACLSISG